MCTSAEVREVELTRGFGWGMVFERESVLFEGVCGVGGVDVVKKDLGFEVAVLRIFATAQSQPKVSNSLVYEFIALARHPK